ncbi:hypothetical protein HN587_00020 [Candidatus Woesearchaeota archaeon]|nr:hypothetical protein [Candidatus Woesearchaeota archaeon]
MSSEQNKLITPPEIITTGGSTYWRTGGELYLPENIDEDPKTEEPKILTAEERVLEELAGPGKVISEQNGLVVVREPTRWEKFVTGAKDTLERLKDPKIAAYATGVALVALTGLPTTALADGSVELTTGHDYATLDTKVFTEVAPLTNLFMRQITTMDYDGNTDLFFLADLSVNLVDGLDVVIEGQAIPGVGVIPRAGLQYFGQFDDFSIYSLATVKTMDHPDGEIVINLGYTPGLTGDVDLLLNLEDLTSVGEDGHNFSVQKLRAGITLYERYMVGAALDLTEIGNQGDLSYNIGGFIGLKL